MLRRGRGIAALVWFTVVAACVIDDVSLAGKECDPEDDVCTTGYVCNPKTRICVKRGTDVCAEPKDCEGAETECNERACGDEGLCALAPRTEIRQLAGDCRARVCEGDAVADAPDATDPFDDADPCTDDGCVDGARTHEPAAAGTACPAGVCDGAGRCVACDDAVAPCVAPDVCVAGGCVPVTCTDRVQNGLETSVDCGGSECAPCGDGLACVLGVDCESGVCAATMCAPPACDDTVRNGAETDVDCGGPDCVPCGPASACSEDADCESGRCAPGAKCAAACDNGARDTGGGETDVDCGGPDCPACLAGQSCVTENDCATHHCCDTLDGRRCYQAPCPPG
jgi:hypothetical protein